MNAGRELLHEQELHLRLEALPIAIYATDAAGKVTYFNQATVAFVGEPSNLHGDEWWGSWRLFRPDGTMLLHDEIPTAVTLQQRRAARVQIVAERPNGTRIAFTAHSAPVFDDRGQISGTVNALVANGEHERIEADYQLAEPSPEGRTQIISNPADKLQTSERSFRMLVESVTDYAIFMLDSEGHVANWNPGAERSKAIRALRSSGSTFLASIRKKTEPPGSLRKPSLLPEAKGVSNRKTGGFAKTVPAFGLVSSSTPFMMNKAKSLGLPR